MNTIYDIIVIGGGHNGLTTATALARKHKKVLVLERRPVLGGTAAGEEFYPGYHTTGLLHDTSGVRRSVIEALELEKFGLKLKPSRAAVSILSKDGRCLHVHA
ncbi:MAG: FAD-dependent oxidoreductase, partial [Sinomicrobium sp.]|nr:FAD-dependent oxidoreductase [Sinomicrobium sp.]